jgi:hypothetical protein
MYLSCSEWQRDIELLGTIMLECDWQSQLSMLTLVGICHVLVEFLLVERDVRLPESELV